MIFIKKAVHFFNDPEYCKKYFDKCCIYRMSKKEKIYTNALGMDV